MKSAALPTVFIIDDDKGMRQAIEDLVESVGLRAETFASGEEFLSRRHISGPSCLVLDARLPQMSGLDFQRWLTETGTQIPIIFITAHGDILNSSARYSRMCSGPKQSGERLNRLEKSSTVRM